MYINVQVQAAVVSRHAVNGSLTGSTCMTPCTRACGANLQLGPIDHDVLVKDVPSVARLIWSSAGWPYPFLIRPPRPSAVFPIASVECTSVRVYMPFTDGATKFWGVLGKIKVGADSPVVYDLLVVGLATAFPASAYDTKTGRRNVPPWC